MKMSALSGFALTVPISGRRTKITAADPLSGFVSYDGKDTIVVDSDSETEVLQNAFDLLQSDGRFFGLGLIDTDLRHLAFRAAINKISTPDSILSAIKTKACVPDAQFLDYKRLCGISCAENPQSAIFAALRRPVGSPRDQAALHRQLAGAMSFHGDMASCGIKDPFAVDMPPQLFPRINIARFSTGDTAFFHWITKPLAHLLAEGPAGKGWGRVSPEVAALNRRNSPGCYRICGFSASISGTVSSFLGESESEAISKGIEWLGSVRRSSRVYVNEPSAWRYFSSARAMVAECQLPGWLFGEDGKLWIYDSASAIPAFGKDFGAELLRFCIEKDAVVSAAGLMELLPPLWCGQSIAEVDANAYTCAAAAFISTSPYITALSASPV